MKMKRKSENSLFVAQMLINNGKPTQSVHCSYYGVFQLMCHKLANAKENPIPYESQETLMGGQSSHEQLLIEIKERISNLRERRNFAQDFRDLKSKRKEADYTERFFSQEESADCKSQAERLVSQLNRFIKTAS